MNLIKMSKALYKRHWHFQEVLQKEQGNVTCHHRDQLIHRLNFLESFEPWLMDNVSSGFVVWKHHNITSVSLSSIFPLSSPCPSCLSLGSSSTSTLWCSSRAAVSTAPSRLNRKTKGRVMSSVESPSPTIWNRGVSSLLLPSRWSAKENKGGVRTVYSLSTSALILFGIFSKLSTLTVALYFSKNNNPHL